METTTTTRTNNNAVINYNKTARPSVVGFVRKCGGNIMRYAAVMEKVFEDGIKQMNGYERFTTFVHDLAIAECFGDSAIRDTNNRVCAHWLSDYKYFTEYMMSLNHLCWFWHYNNEPDLSRLYGDLYYSALDLFDNRYGPAEGDSPEVLKKKSEACEYRFRCMD